MRILFYSLNIFSLLSIVVSIKSFISFFIHSLLVVSLSNLVSSFPCFNVYDGQKSKKTYSLIAYFKTIYLEMLYFHLGFYLQIFTILKILLLTTSYDSTLIFFFFLYYKGAPFLLYQNALTNVGHFILFYFSIILRIFAIIKYIGILFYTYFHCDTKIGARLSFLRILT